MAAPSAVEPYFRLRERGTSVFREVRGGVATFFALAYIVVLNPLILGSGKDLYGHTLSTAQLTVATAVVAGVMTVLMGLGGDLPLAVAAGAGLSGGGASTSAPPSPWPDGLGRADAAGAG